MKVHLPFLLLAVGLGLTGCAGPQVGASTPNSVLMVNVAKWDAPKALQLAEAECLKHGKHAVPMPDDTPDYQKTYECKN